MIVAVDGREGGKGTWRAACAHSISPFSNRAALPATAMHLAEAGKRASEVEAAEAGRSW